MKKVLIAAGLCVSAMSFASTIFVEAPLRQYDLSPGIEQVIYLDQGLELRVSDITDYTVVAAKEVVTFQIQVVRSFDPVTGMSTNSVVCSNELEVPFNSEATLIFSKLGLRVRFVAMKAGDAVINVQDPIVAVGTVDTTDPLTGEPLTN